MKEVVLFILTFIIVFIVYKFIIIRSGKKKKKNNKRPVEVELLVKKYNIDIKKINYKRLLILISLINSLNITIVVTIVTKVESFVLAILLALLIPTPLILISYSLIGNYYKKKGLIKDE